MKKKIAKIARLEARNRELHEIVGQQEAQLLARIEVDPAGNGEEIDSIVDDGMDDLLSQLDGPRGTPQSNWSDSGSGSAGGMLPEGSGSNAVNGGPVTAGTQGDGD